MNEHLPIVLSHFQVAPLLLARAHGESSPSVSPDLGLSAVQVRPDAKGIHFPTGEILSWPDAETIADSENGCFVLREDGIEKI